MSTYEVTFERIGRNHDVPPLVIDADDADDLAEGIYDYAFPKVASSDVEVVVNLEEGRGMIYCGFHNGGTFTIAERAA